MSIINSIVSSVRQERQIRLYFLALHYYFVMFYGKCVDFTHQVFVRSASYYMNLPALPRPPPSLSLFKFETHLPVMSSKVVKM